MLKKELLRLKRKKSIRKKINGTSERPRLSINRSNRYIYVQLIDDVNRKTILGLGDSKYKEKSKVERAKKLGMEFAKLIKEKKVTKVVFDRSGYKYHGRVKAFADAAREGGLEF